MAEDHESIVLQILRELQEGQSRIQGGQQQTNERLSAIEHHMAGFHGSLVRFDTVVDELDSRISRIERRLKLTDTDTAKE